jgi:plasmid stability protein
MLSQKESVMGSMTVRKIDDEVMRELRISAARRGVSMEQEARDRLRQPLSRPGVESKAEQGDKQRDLDASVDEILAFGRRLPKVDFDIKKASDELYDYLDRE